MRDAEKAISELAFLFKLTPMIQEVDSVDRIYRLLLAITTTGRTIGYRRAMVFVVDTQNAVLRGRYGVERVETEEPQKPPTFEEMAREVFKTYENVEGTDLNVKARTFAVPLAWHRSALVKSAKTAYPVLAERQLSEFSSDPFFDFFGTDRYIAVPIKFNNRTMAVLAADRLVGDSGNSVDDISILYSLSQQASLAAQRLMESSESKRRSRILWRLHQTLNAAETREKVEEALRLALIMLSRAVGASGCLLKDLTRQKTYHIKTVQEYSPEADDTDIAISESFEEILDRAAGTVESIAGDGTHPFLNEMVSDSVAYFFAVPLVVGDEVAGALCLYTVQDDNHDRAKDYRSEDKSFLELCSGVIASKIEGDQKDGRINRVEDFLQEVSANLVREREQSMLGDRSVDYHTRITQDLKALRQIMSTKSPYNKRFPKISKLVKSMLAYSDEYIEGWLTRNDHYQMTDLFTMTKKIVQPWRSDLEKRGIELTVRVPSRGPSLLIDKTKIALAIQNIMKTTVSCLKEGDKLMVECSASDDRVLICIADNGAGVPGDAISRLFLPFESIDIDDEKKRALSLAGEVLQKHFGEIMIKSSMSWNTILVLSLPFAANRDRRKKSPDRRRRSERRLVSKDAH